TGLSPSRASSSAHNSTGRDGSYRRDAARNASSASKPPPLFRGGGGLRVAGPGHHQPESQLLQPAPAGCGVGGDAEAGAGVGGDLRPRPQPTVGRLLPQGFVEFGLLPRRQRTPTLVGLAAVGQAGGAVVVPALEDGAGVDVRQPDQGGGLLAAEGRARTQEQPDQVPA